MDIIKRILNFIDYKGISKRQFYRETGFSNGFLDKITNVGTDKIEKIISVYPELNLEWLILGNGEMIGKSDGEYRHESKISGKTPNINEDKAKYTVNATAICSTCMEKDRHIGTLRELIEELKYEKGILTQRVSELETKVKELEESGNR